MNRPKIFSSIEGVEFYKVKKYSNSNKKKIKRRCFCYLGNPRLLKPKNELRASNLIFR